MKFYEKQVSIYLDDETLGIIDRVAKKFRMKRSNAVRFVITEFGKNMEKEDEKI